MKEVYRVAPVPAGDVSGICAALYELGGMVVMHDPSGCNSTYNTHDELRWYRKPASIFISACSMRDLVLGRDDKLMDDITAAFESISPRPRFIALCNSPLPYLNGTDFEGICRQLEKRCSVPCFFVPSNGMHDYITGVGEAWLRYAQSLVSGFSAGVARLTTEENDSGSLRREVEPADRANPIPVNLLGLTPLDYANPENVRRLESLLSENGFSVLANFAYETNAERLCRTPEAAVNLLLSAAGLPLAEYLYEKYGTSYVVGAPLKGFSAPVLAALRAVAEGKAFSQLSYDRENDTRPVEAVFIGEAVLMASLARAWELAHGKRAYVLCPFEKSIAVLPPSLGRCAEGEEGLEQALCTLAEDITLQGQRSEKMPVFADPLYGAILPESCVLQPLPSLGISGRLYRGSFPIYF